MPLPATPDLTNLPDSPSTLTMPNQEGTTTTVRPLTENDWTSWWRLRLLALASHPDAYAQDVRDALAEDVDQARERFLTHRIQGDNRIFGSFTPDGELVGIASITRSDLRKLRHRMDISGVYVAPAARGNGVGAQVITACIDHARAIDGVLQIHVGVASHNDTAIRLYERCGFDRYAREPRLLLLPDGTVVDEDLMVVMLDA